MKRVNKADRIVDCALELLKTEGDHGVTMRQVALRSEMSLSNVQYYFRNKDELLKAMADRYFGLCIQDIQEQVGLTAGGDTEAELSAMLREYLEYGLEISEMCRIFREYWAIATRNEVIEQYLNDYYKRMIEALSHKLEPAAASPDALTNAVSLLIPYVEGYTITSRALPVEMEQANRMLVSVVMSLLRDDSEG